MEKYQQAQRIISSRGAVTVNDTCLGAGIHGLVSKSATSQNLPSLQRNLNRKGRIAFLSRGIPVYSSTPVYISHKYKFIYIRTAKSSSSTLLSLIKETFCASTPCMPDEFTLAGLSTAIDSETWSSYFVFTWVRNPFARALSALTMFNERFLFTPTPDSAPPTDSQRCSVPWSTFAGNSYYLVRFCRMRDCCVYFDEVGWSQTFACGNINEQSHNVFTASGESMVDFIGRTERFDDDWAELLRHLEERLGQRIPFVQSRLRKARQAEGGVEGVDPFQCPSATSLEMFNATTLGSIARQYALDLLRFGFAPTSDRGQLEGWLTEV